MLALRPVILALLAAAAGPAPASAAPADDRTLARVLEVARAKGGAPGAQATVVKDGRVLAQAAAGKLRRGRGAKAVRVGDRFVLASVTKPITAAQVLRLVDGGRITLEDPIARYVPGLPNGDEITVGMLLAHRSGLGEYADDARLARTLEDPRHRWTGAEVLAAVARRPAQFAPGRRTSYSNSGYLVLGALVRAVTGGSQQADLRRMAAPLGGLPTLGFGRQAGRARLAHGFTREEGGRALSSHDGPGGVDTDAIGEPWSDGGLASSATDVARWYDAVQRDVLLAPATAALMRTETAPGSGRGLGLELETEGGRTVVGHSGVYGGFDNDVRTDRTSGVTIAVLTNLEDDDDRSVSHDIMERLLARYAR